jgi:hypothetical protein
MRIPFGQALAVALLLRWSCVTGWSDPVIPGNILDPKTSAEAWNVLRLATKNIQQLIDEERLADIPVQASYCSPSLRALARLATAPEAIAEIQPRTTRAIDWLSAIARNAQANNPPGTRDAFQMLQGLLAEMQRHFDPKDLASDIYFCRAHSDFVSDSVATPCARCGMRLVKRRIPSSFIYVAPGPPTIRMTARTSAPIESGRKVEVTIRLEKGDRSPVTHDDLLETHTAPIHLLIEEPGLGDYHHEIPKPTASSGEYAFSLVPAKTAPYRVWADLMPVATGLQELPFVDLPSAGKRAPASNIEPRFTSSAGGCQFTLTMAQGNHIAVQARRGRGMQIAVADANGAPVTQLEPVMNAFAHVVGFYSDFQTVIHLHPTGGEVLDPQARGGPTLGFVLFPPKPGFIRLYCTVSVGGRTLLAPFNLNVEQ